MPDVTEEEHSVWLFTIVSCVITSLLAISILYFMSSTPFHEIQRKEEEYLFLDESSNVRKFPSILEKWSVHLSVIVPAYNEEDRLPPMMDECIAFFDDRQTQNPEFLYEIIVVNDGSTDNTLSVALQYTKHYGSEKVRVLNLTKNRGKGGAVRFGMLSARGAVTLFADADGATRFSDVTKLENELRRLTGINYLTNVENINNYKVIVCGSRAHLENEAIATRSIFRNLLMFGFHNLVRVFSVNNVRDTQCGFKLFTRDAAVQCFFNMHVETWAFDVEVLYIANRFNITISEVAVNWVEIEGSKIVPVLTWMQMGIDLFTIWFKYLTGTWDIAPITKNIK